MKHIVKCAVCGEDFDLNSIQGVRHKHKRRYAHYDCFPEGELVPLIKPKEESNKPKKKTIITEKKLTPKKTKEQEEKDKHTKERLELTDYIQELFGDNVNWGWTTKRIKEYEQLGYTLTGMLKSLKWYYEIQQGEKNRANGNIGIIPFIYKDAERYYYQLFMSQQNNSKKEIKLKESIEIEIPSPRVYIKPKKLFWEDEE